MTSAHVSYTDTPAKLTKSSLPLRVLDSSVLLELQVLLSLRPSGATLSLQLLDALVVARQKDV